MMKNIKEQIKAYEEILAVVGKVKDTIDETVQLGSLEHVVKHLKLSEEFGVPLRSLTGHHDGWLFIQDKYNDIMHLGYFDGDSRSISWSDDGTQPNAEWLFKIGFSTGAYIFSNYAYEYGVGSYPKKTFDAFFEELKEFGPAFCDTNNHCLYFRSNVSAEVYQAFFTLFDKYKSLVDAELKEKRRAELQRELENLK